jgi:hypothetical protein
MSAAIPSGWLDYDFEQAFNCPMRIMNDACMQALGSYEGGKMLYLGLATGLGSAFITDGLIVPLALGHLKLWEGGTLDFYLSRDGLKRHGKQSWRQAAGEAAEIRKMSAKSRNSPKVVVGAETITLTLADCACGKMSGSPRQRSCKLCRKWKRPWPKIASSSISQFLTLIGRRAPT